MLKRGNFHAEEWALPTWSGGGHLYCWFTGGVWVGEGGLSTPHPPTPHTEQQCKHQCGPSRSFLWHRTLTPTKGWAYCAATMLPLSTYLAGGQAKMPFCLSLTHLSKQEEKWQCHALLSFLLVSLPHLSPRPSPSFCSPHSQLKASPSLAYCYSHLDMDHLARDARTKGSFPGFSMWQGCCL